MSYNITTSPRFRKSFAKNSSNTSRLRPRRYAPRHEDLSDYMPAKVQITYLAFRATMNPATRTSIAGMKDIALKTGRDVKTVRIHAQFLNESGVMPSEKRSKFTLTGKKVNLTKRYYFPQLDEDFLASKREGGTPKTGRGSTLADLKQTTTNTLPPTPLRGEVCDAQPEPIQTEPQRPTPDPEVHRALVQARELRTQRKAERRQQRYAGAKERRRSRRCEELSPVQAAVRHVMTVLRFCPALWATREAVRTSVTRWMEERRVGPERAANGLIAAWKDHESLRGLVDYWAAELTWFGQCRWLYPSASELDSLSRMSSASVGTYVAPQRVDLEGLREKMRALIGDFDSNVDTE